MTQWYNLVMGKTRLLPPPPAQPHYEGLNESQRGFVNDLVAQVQEGREVNMSEAARHNWPRANDQTARQIAYQNIHREYIRDAFLAEMARLGLTPTESIGAIKGALKANKLVSSPTEPDQIVPDHNVRLKAAQETNKLLGAYPDQRLDITKQTANISITAGLTDQAIFKEIYRLQRNIKEMQEADKQVKKRIAKA